MKFNENLLEEIENKCDIIELVSKYTILKQQGSNYVGLCPFHSEKTPSFFVNNIKKIYHCFGCGVGGNIITFFMNIENMSYKETINYLADFYNIPLDNKNNDSFEKNIIYEINKLALVYFKNQLKINLQLKEYLKFRNLSENICENFEIGYIFNNKDFLRFLLKKYKLKDIQQSGLINIYNKKIYVFFQNRLIFPIKDTRNNILGFGGRTLCNNVLPKYLNSKENIVFKKKYILFGIDKIIKNKHDFLILVEGYLDVITLYNYGFNNAIASLGTAITIEQLNLIKKYNNNLIVVFDNDKAGNNAINILIEKVINNIKNFNVKIAILNSAKDPDEFLNKFGKEKFQEILNNSCYYIDYKINLIKLKYNNDLDENTNNKFLFLKEVIEFLKYIIDPLEKELYIQKISNDFNINLDKNFKNKNIFIKNEFEKTKQNKVSKFIKAEEIIIKILFNNFNNNLSKYISIIEKEFEIIDNYIMDDNNKKIIKIIINLHKNNINNMLSLENIFNNNNIDFKYLIKISTDISLINNQNASSIFNDCIFLLKWRYYKNNNLLKEFIELTKNKKGNFEI